LVEIKDMVISTIEHNGENIKSFFLLDFTEKIINLKNKKKDIDIYIKIANEISSRIEFDDVFFGRHK
jgi:hypothetical protein